MKKILGLAVILCSMQAIALGSSVLNFNGFDQNDPIKNKFSLVHFTLPDTNTNNYIGSFFWLPSVQATGTIQIAGDSRTCRKQVRGLYYINAQGSRLWPLDQQSLNGLRLLDSSYNGLQVNGGIYTTCGLSGSTDIYSIYGQITYTDTGGVELNRLTAGVNYDATSNTVASSIALQCSLQYFNNQTPIGYIYDNIGGIGFVGGQLAPSVHQSILSSFSSSTCVNNIFAFGSTQNDIVANVGGGSYPLNNNAYAGLDTLWNISVLGNVLLSRGGLDATDRQSIFGNPSQSSSVIFSDVVNTSDILNTLRKNSSTLCRGKAPITNIGGGAAGGALSTLAIGNAANSVCIYNDNGDETYDDTSAPLTIDLNADSSIYNGRDIIVKGRNVILIGSMPDTDSALNLFVDNGNVFLERGTTTWKFDKDGSPLGITSSATDTGVNYGKYIKGNIFVNGIIAGNVLGTNAPAQISDKYYIQGRVASLNTAYEPSVQRVTMLQNIFGTTAASLNNFVNRGKNVFTWTCQLNGVASNGLPCQVPNDQFKDSALVLINTPIQTRLFK